MHALRRDERIERTTSVDREKWASGRATHLDEIVKLVSYDAFVPSRRVREGIRANTIERVERSGAAGRRGRHRGRDVRFDRSGDVRDSWGATLDYYISR